MRYTQPQSSARIARQFRSIPGIGFLFQNSASDIFESLGRLSYFNAPTPIILPNGIGKKLDGSTQYATFVKPAFVDPAKPYTIAISFVPTSLAAISRIFVYGTASTSVSLVSSVNGQLSLVSSASSSGTTARATTAAGAAVVGKVCNLVASFDGVGWSLFVNGVKSAATLLASLANQAINADFNIGRRENGTSFFNGSVALFAYLQAYVDPVSLSANPWQLFEGAESVYPTAAGADLSASPKAIAQVATGLTTAITLAGNAPSSALSLASLTTAMPMSAAVGAKATALSSLTTAMPISAAVGSRATALSSLTTAMPMSAAVGSRATALSSLTTAMPMSAAVGSVASCTAAIQSGALLSADASASSTVRANLTTAILLSAPVAAIASCTASIQATSAISAFVAAVSSVNANLTTNIALSAAPSGVAKSSAVLDTLIDVATNYHGISTALAVLSSASPKPPKSKHDLLGNLYSQAIRLIPPSEIEYIAHNGRVLNAARQWTPNFLPPITTWMSVQSVSRSLYKTFGLDLQKSYIKIFAAQSIIDIRRDTSGDRFIFCEKLYQVESNNDWFLIDGWLSCIAVEIGVAE